MSLHHTRLLAVLQRAWFPVKQNIVDLNNCMFRDLEHNKVVIANMWVNTFQNKGNPSASPSRSSRHPLRPLRVQSNHRFASSVLELYLKGITQYHFGFQFFFLSDTRVSHPLLFLSPQCLCSCPFPSIPEYCIICTLSNPLSHNT